MQNHDAGGRLSPTLLLVAAMLPLAVAGGPAIAGGGDRAETDEAAYPPYHGPRTSIAVAGFDANGAFLAQYGGWNPGAGLAAMLATELARTDRFVVVERPQLDEALHEQQLTVQRLAATEAALPGRLLGARLLVQGTVTDFQQAEGGGGVRLAFGASALKSAVGRRTRRGRVAIDLRLVEATTGRIVQALTVEKKVKTKSVAFDVTRGDLALTGDRFRKTALGQATREAIREATRRIVEALGEVPWQALVADADGRRVYINAGRDANLEPGGMLLCRRELRQITDPATGRVLGSEHAVVGRLQLEEVREQFSVAQLVSGELPQRGDLVTLDGRGRLAHGAR